MQLDKEHIYAISICRESFHVIVHRDNGIQRTYTNVTESSWHRIMRSIINMHPLRSGVASLYYYRSVYATRNTGLLMYTSNVYPKCDVCNQNLWSQSERDNQMHVICALDRADLQTVQIWSR